MPPMTDILNYQLELSALSPRDIIKRAVADNADIAVSFSGAEDVVLVDMISKLSSKPRVFTLDTGRLHPETYRYLETVRNHYQIDIEVFTPDHIALQGLVKEKGLFSFFTDGHQECCGIRKIEPLTRALLPLDAWISGQRRDQSPDTRSSVPVVQQDALFKGKNETLIKYNPLANWSSAEVWNYIKMFELPVNPLHLQGFKSIGCEPCTAPTLPNQHEREGRWWWEEATQKECGLHAEKATG
ncbi:phosphoadenylyl-sulfate reductase [Reinekea sp.]|uniref:phosphoadenylyl-sulfate reductase n=1 Tax=Reinekea sp. TaxID=1970455 RepID=UPI0039C24642